MFGSRLAVDRFVSTANASGRLEGGGASRLGRRKDKREVTSYSTFRAIGPTNRRGILFNPQPAAGPAMDFLAPRDAGPAANVPLTATTNKAGWNSTMFRRPSMDATISGLSFSSFDRASMEAPSATAF